MTGELIGVKNLSWKVKCDGTRPVCGTCLKRKGRDVFCRYSGDTFPEAISRDVHHPCSVNDERWHLSSNAQEPHHRNNDVYSESPRRAVESSDRTSNSLQNNGIIPSPASSNRAYADDNVQPSQPNDIFQGVNSMTGATESRTHGFFGSSSAGSFMNQIKTAIDAKIQFPCQSSPYSETERGGPSSLTITERKSPKSIELLDYDLPSRRTADSLLDVYWDLVDPLYPFLDKTRFLRLYSSLWTTDAIEGDERLIISICNVIFALSCQLSRSIKMGDRESHSKVYFKRAQNVLQLSFWDSGSIEGIQCLLLMGQYLQSTRNAHQCWMVVGHAIRIAQGIGLHLPESLNDQSPRERELARRIWHGCIFMDRVLSMTFGRPAMISKQVADMVPYPAMIDDEFLSEDLQAVSPQPEGRPAKIAFYVKSLQLYDIVGNILSRLYIEDDGRTGRSQNGSCIDQSRTSDIGHVLQLDRSLIEWTKGLPPHLSLLSPASFANVSVLRQATISRLRFLHARILLLRPVLSLFCLPQTVSKNPGIDLDESLDQRIAVQCSILCLRTAHELIELIYSHFYKDGSVGVLPAWWYCIFYIYTAATVLLASRLRPSLEGENPKYNFADSWSHALEILRSIDCLDDSAQRCVAVLEILNVTISLAPDSDDQAQQQQQLHPESNTVTTHPEGMFNDLQMFPGLDNITFDPHDMSWLSSLPGNI